MPRSNLDTRSARRKGTATFTSRPMISTKMQRSWDKFQVKSLVYGIARGRDVQQWAVGDGSSLAKCRVGYGVGA